MSRYSHTRSFNRFSINRSVRIPRRSFGQVINPSRFVNKAVAVTQTETFVPQHSFADFNLNQRLAANIAAKGYKAPTPIQDKIIPHILAGLDVVGVANTGTGKTGAFLIPLIERIVKNPRERIIIIAPTRELALQINQELKTFVRGMDMYSACCVGG